MQIERSITMLEHELEQKDKVLDDLDGMAIKILNATCPYSDADKAMIALIESLEAKVGAERRALHSRLTGAWYHKHYNKHCQPEV
jgi:hypothetical protein